MEIEHYLFLATLALITVTPGLVLARAPSLKEKSPWVKLYVFVGVTVALFPVAIILALFIFGYVLGIDLLD